MIPVTLGAPDDDSDAAVLRWARQALTEFERASFAFEIGEIADNYTITGTLTETRNLDVSSPTAQNIADVLGTFLLDLKRRGSKVQS